MKLSRQIPARQPNPMGRWLPCQSRGLRLRTRKDLPFPPPAGPPTAPTPSGTPGPTAVPAPPGPAGATGGSPAATGAGSSADPTGPPDASRLWPSRSHHGGTARPPGRRAPPQNGGSGGSGPGGPTRPARPFWNAASAAWRRTGAEGTAPWGRSSEGVNRLKAGAPREVILLSCPRLARHLGPNTPLKRGGNHSARWRRSSGHGTGGWSPPPLTRFPAKQSAKIQV